MNDEEENKKQKRMRPLHEVPGWQYILLGVVIVTLIAMYAVSQSPSTDGTALMAEQIAQHGPTTHHPVEMFYYPSCGWCKKQFTIMDRLGVRDQFILINTADHEDLVKKYEIRGTPAFRDNVTGQVWIGYLNETEFQKFLDYEHIKTN